MNEKQEKLIKLLEEMFQLNQTDLDFGIYRIMNQKADEIKQFLQKDLIYSIQNAFAQNSNDSLQKELDALITNITNAGMNPDDSPKVQELKEKLLTSSNNESNENEIYSHLTNFFSRYYKDGDFVTLRRYKKDTYAVPYEGEEVKLHWANSDQYYIKTSEFFRDYTFKTKTHTVHFKLQEAQTSTNNNKSDKRVFVYQSHEELGGELYIYFTYEDGKNHSFPTDINIQKYSLDEPKETKANPKRTLLEKHLNDYTSRNSFDYFIHKDLKGFLSRELDFFIKNEILYIDDILDVSISAIEASMNKIKTFKIIAQKIIAFLSQLEEFQKKLWLKKKFVIGVEYCITLDKIDEKYYEEILNNSEQLKEWKSLFNVEVKSVEDLKKEKFLALDTKFFSDDVKDKLLSEFDDIDEQTDGVLINSENFGALNLLQERYKEQVKTVYIDPPYNTGGDDFIYKDNYQHSSWLSMMYDRLSNGVKFIKRSGQIAMSIDLKELDKSVSLFDAIFGEENRKNFITIKRGSVTGAKVVNPGVVNISEYILTYSIDTKEWDPQRAYRQKMYDNRYGTVIINPEDRFSMWKFQSVLDSFSEEKGIEKSKLKKELGEIFEDELTDFVIRNAARVIRLASLDEKSVSKEAVKLKQQSLKEKNKILFLERSDKNDYYILNGNIILFYKDRLQLIGDKLLPGEPISDIWDDVLPNDLHNEGGVSLRKGKKPEKLIHRIIEMSSREKELVMDFFAGSGTSCAVAQKSKRKWIGIEQGDYFDDIALCRMKNTLQGDTSGITDMTNWHGGGFLKYFKLESYEDTLNNLAFKSVDKDLFSDDVKEDYLLNYMLDYETNKSLLNIDTFKTPFDYKLRIATSTAGETTETNIDLVETFNYLIGLKVKTRVKNEGFLVVQGENLREEKILVIWRDGKSNDELNQFFSKMDFIVKTREFDTIYVNGDNNLANLKTDVDHFKVKLIEEEFKTRMFGE